MHLFPALPTTREESRDLSVNRRGKRYNQRPVKRAPRHDRGRSRLQCRPVPRPLSPSGVRRSRQSARDVAHHSDLPAAKSLLAFLGGLLLLELDAEPRVLIRQLRVSHLPAFVWPPSLKITGRRL